MSAAPFLLAFTEGGPASSFVQFVPILIVFGIFYFLLIAPMRKRQKALQQVIADLKKGDRVVTTGGIYGEVAAVEDKVVQLKIADKVRIRVAKSAIGGIQGEESKQ